MFLYLTDDATCSQPLCRTAPTHIQKC